MHLPILVKETLKVLEPKKDENFVDATFGEGGFSFELAKHLDSGKVLAFEWDPELYKLGVEKIKNLKMEKKIKLVNRNFKNIKRIVKKEGFNQIKGVVFDLGISTWHYEKSRRGFSFKYDEPLDMRINPKIKVTAFEIINYYSYKDLVEIFKNYGQEKEAEKVATEIIKRRSTKKIETSKELAQIIAEVKKIKKKKLHPATQIFMALRSFINNELVNIYQGVKDSYDILAEGGKIIVISFQGLEDKIIKKVFKYLKELKDAQIITKKVIKPSREEILKNPKARSAKLRALAKPKK